MSDSTPDASETAQARTLIQKADASFEAGRHEEAFAQYTEVDDRFGEAAEPTL